MKKRAIGRLVTTLFASALATTLYVGVESGPASADAWDTYKKSMNSSEKSWCKWPSRWNQCLLAYGSDGAAWAMPRATECSAPRCANGDEQNALQHCLWSAIMKLRQGESTATGFLGRHEANSHNDDDSKRDWENNHKGFDVAAQVAVDLYMDSTLNMHSAVLDRCWALADSDQLTYQR